MTRNHQSFLSRLDHLSGGRDWTPWLQDAGLTSGTINGIKNEGRPPSAEVLRAVSNYDNASMVWLSEGKGQPYYVYRALDDEDGRQHLDELLAESWEITLGWLGETEQFLVILTQPGTYRIKKREVSYTILELLAGNLGHQTAQRIHQAMVEGAPVKEIRLAEQLFQQCTLGQVGTYQLVGWKNDPGILNRSTRLHKPLRVAEPRPDYITDREEELVSQFRRLPKNEQTALLTVSRSMARERHDSVQVEHSRGRVLDAKHVHKIKDPDGDEAPRTSKAKADPSTVDN